MAKKKLWNSEKEAVVAARKAMDEFRLLIESFRCNAEQMGIEAVSRMFGHSIAHCLVKISEIVLNLGCRDHSSPDGMFAFPTLKDAASRKNSADIMLPPIACFDAKVIIAMMKECDRSMDICPEQLLTIFIAAEKFIEVMAGWAEKSRRIINDLYDEVQDGKSELEYFIDNRKSHSDHNRMHMIILRKGEEEYSDDELDAIYAIKKKNKDKHIAPVYILEIMKKYSSREKRLGVYDVQGFLENEYGVSMERKAVGRTLTQLQEADYLCRMEKENGYWYDEELLRRNSEI